MTELCADFIRRAERITSFNIETRDFERLCYKREIQTLITKHFFPTFDMGKTLETLNKEKFNQRILELKEHDLEMFDYLHKYHLKGVGPGEVTLFYLVDKAHLGGGSSAGVDIVVCGDQNYEVKAVKVSRDSYAYDFRLGGTVQLYDIMHAITELREHAKLAGSNTEVTKTVLNQLRELYPKEFQKIEDQFIEVTAEYFSDHEVIFINHSKSRQKMGMIEAIKYVKPEDIRIDRVSTGTIKPMVKL